MILQAYGCFAAIIGASMLLAQSIRICISEKAINMVCCSCWLVVLSRHKTSALICQGAGVVRAPASSVLLLQDGVDAKLSTNRVLVGFWRMLWFVN